MAKIVSNDDLKNDRVFYRIDNKTKDYLISVAKERNKPINKVALELVSESQFHKPFDDKLRNLEKYIHELEATVEKQNKVMNDFMLVIRGDINKVFSPDFIQDIINKIVEGNRKRPKAKDSE